VQQLNTLTIKYRAIANDTQDKLPCNSQKHNSYHAIANNAHKLTVQ